MIRIANAQGFWGDRNDAAAQVMEHDRDIDYLTLDYLAEVSMSIMAIQREKNPEWGYARDFLNVVRTLIPYWKEDAKVVLISNAGGLNPEACAKACMDILKEESCPLKLALVDGDDVLPVLQSEEGNFTNLDSGKNISTVQDCLVTANAYLGAEGMLKALQEGAQLIITGRIADPSMAVAPCMHHYSLDWHDYDFLASATLAGHLIECGTQVTGGIWTEWLSIDSPENLGFPIVEIHEDASLIIGKVKNTGGVVNTATVKEQLLYEIGDPSAYLSPDVIVSIMDLSLEEVGKDRVQIRGAKGRAPSDQYKVSATYRDGFRAEGMLSIVGADAVKKGRRCGEVILKRLENAGLSPERYLVECLGAGDSVGGILPKGDPLEIILRIAVADKNKEVLQYFSKELAPLVTNGAPGLSGYTSGRPKPRPIFGFWPCLIPKDKCKVTCQLFEVTNGHS